MIIDPTHPLDTIEQVPGVVLSVAHNTPTPVTDMIVGIAVVGLLWGALWLAFAGELGKHRAGFLVPAVHSAKPTLPGQRRVLIKLRETSWSAVFSSQNARSLGRAVERERHLHAVADMPTQPVIVAEIVRPETHHDADTFEPLAEIAAASTPDAEWDSLMASARRELIELHADDREWAKRWDAMMAGFRGRVGVPLDEAQGWHAEHGRHCECCHAGADADDGTDRLAVWREWRIDEDTVSIPVAQLVAAGVRD